MTQRHRAVTGRALPRNGSAPRVIGTCYSIKNTGIEGAKLNAKDCYIQELSEKATRSAIWGGLAGQKHTRGLVLCPGDRIRREEISIA